MKARKRLRWMGLLVAAVGAGVWAEALATKPAGHPKDSTLDWLLSQAATAPATTRAAEEPTTQPASPFVQEADAEARQGTILLSDGQKLSGSIRTTQEKPLRVWDEQEKQYRDIPLAQVQSVKAEVIWEREQPEWHFKESGSDIKEYTGKSYPARELRYRLHLVGGEELSGGIVAPLYVKSADEEKLLVLNKRQKGEAGQKLEQLVYVKRVEFGRE